MTRIKTDMLANEVVFKLQNGEEYRLLIDTLNIELVKDNFGQDCIFINNRLWKVEEVI